MNQDLPTFFCPCGHLIRKSTIRYMFSNLVRQILVSSNFPEFDLFSFSYTVRVKISFVRFDSRENLGKKNTNFRQKNANSKTVANPAGNDTLRTFSLQTSRFFVNERKSPARAEKIDTRINVSLEGLGQIGICLVFLVLADVF